MAVLIKSDLIDYRYRQARYHESHRSVRRRRLSEWVSERGLSSRDFESFSGQSPSEDIEVSDKTIVQASPEPTVLRPGRGSLRGQLVMTDDWDSPEVNDAIARAFGLEK